MVSESTPTAPNTAPNSTITAFNAAALSREERDRRFNEAAEGMTPENAPKRALDPLTPWWPQIKRKLQQGYSSRQIHTMTRSPRVGVQVSFRSLQRFITEHTAARSDKVATRAAAKV